MSERPRRSFGANVLISFGFTGLTTVLAFALQLPPPAIAMAHVMLMPLNKELTTFGYHVRERSSHGIDGPKGKWLRHAQQLSTAVPIWVLVVVRTTLSCPYSSHVSPVKSAQPPTLGCDHPGVSTHGGGGGGTPPKVRIRKAASVWPGSGTNAPSNVPSEP